MKTLIILVHICALIDFSIGHSLLTEPPIRRNYDTAWSGGWLYQYFMRGGDVHVCGGGNAQITGPVARTYKSGQLINASIRVGAGHHGFYRIKLCVLKSPKDVVTEDCFNQNVLKINPITYVSDDINEPEILNKIMDAKSLRIDDYTFNQPTTKTSNNININFTVQLPPGLTCANCVLQWVWYQYSPLSWKDYTCKFLSKGSSIVANRTVSGIENYPCKFHNWRTCSDIQILADPKDRSIYKPNPLIQTSYPQTFQCFRSFGSDAIGLANDAIGDLGFSAVGNTVRDWNLKYPAKFQPGAQLFCVIVSTAAPNSCELCRLNCGSPGKTCPDYCLCSWSPLKQKSYQVWMEDFKIPNIGPVPWKADNTTTACDFSDGFQVIKQIPNSQSKDCPNLCKSTDKCTHYVWYFKEIDSKNIALGVCSLIWGTPLKALYSADLKNIGAVTPNFFRFFDKCGIISK